MLKTWLKSGRWAQPLCPTAVLLYNKHKRLAAAPQGAGPGSAAPQLGPTAGHWVLTWERHQCGCHARFCPWPEAPLRGHSTQLVWLGFSVCFGQQAPNQSLRSHACLLCSTATCLGPSLLGFSFSGDDLYIPSHPSEALCCSSSAPSRRWVLTGSVTRGGLWKKPSGS